MLSSKKKSLWMAVSDGLAGSINTLPFASYLFMHYFFKGSSAL
ncbi:hypothetical protein D019_2582 [Vibrio parahaemolyticus VP2007-095]|nr:hypothetical protein D019_2582 [Vibrio parahaemolyticus VP2007-095]